MLVARNVNGPCGLDPGKGQKIGLLVEMGLTTCYLDGFESTRD